MSEPDQKTIYRFVRTLFNAAQLPPECAIITLVYLERLLTYAETTIGPNSWKRDRVRINPARLQGVG